MNAHFPPDRHVNKSVPALANESRAVDAHVESLAYPSLGTEGAQSQVHLKLLKVVDLLLKHKVLIGCCIAAALLIGYVKTFLSTPIYSTSTTIQIDARVQSPINSRHTNNLDDGNDYSSLQTQFELLKSRSLAERVATSLNLVDDPDFLSLTGTSSWSKLRKLLTGGSAKNAPEVRTPTELEALQGGAVGVVMGGLLVQPVQNSRVVRITFRSPNPRLAQKLSISVAENFVAAAMDRRFNASGYAREFLQERLQQVKLKLEESEKQLVAYAQKEGIVTDDKQMPETMARFTSLNAAVAGATAERVKNEQLWQQAQSGNGLYLPQIVNDKSVQAARDKRAQLAAEYQDKLNVLKPAFPEMMQLKSQINELDKQVRVQVDLIRESIRAQYESSRAQEASLKEQLKELRADALDLRGRSIEYTILQREADTNRALYDGLLQQYKELAVAGGAESNNISIIDRAQLPGGPISPNLTTNLLIALLFGAALSAAVIFILEIWDDTFKSPDELEGDLGLPVLGVTPLSEIEEASALTQDILTSPTSPLAEAYRSLRTALQFSTVSGAPKVMLVTSSRPSEGKSTTSICLAMNFAQLGMRVLLIDGDLRNPSLHRYLGMDNSAGLSNYLTGANQGTDPFRESQIKDVAVLTAGPVPPNPAELLAGPNLLSLLGVASERFDLVIIDGPPIMGLADAPILASATSGTLLMVQAGGTRRALVRASVKRLRMARGRITGVVLTKVNAKKTGYGYGYGYDYDYDYGSGRLDGAEKALTPAQLPNS